MRLVIEDTRNKIEKNAYIRQQLHDLGFEVVRSKLLVGDYQIANKGNIVVDTKADLQEVVVNVTSQHKRFKAECEMAKEAGIKLVVLIRESTVKSLEDVPKWFNWRLKVSPVATTGKQLWKIMTTLTQRYGVEWRFATPKNMGQAIVDILEEKDE